MISLILILLFQFNLILCCKQLNDCFESKGRGQCAFDVQKKNYFLNN